MSELKIQPLGMRVVIQPLEQEGKQPQDCISQRQPRKSRNQERSSRLEMMRRSSSRWGTVCFIRNTAALNSNWIRKNIF